VTEGEVVGDGEVSGVGGSAVMLQPVMALASALARIRPESGDLIVDPYPVSDVPVT